MMMLSRIETGMDMRNIAPENKNKSHLNGSWWVKEREVASGPRCFVNSQYAKRRNKCEPKKMVLISTC
jgi:hypothetical protein